MKPLHAVVLVTGIWCGSSTQTPVQQGASLIGLWDSVTTSQGGIGTTLEFRSDATFVEATTVIVNSFFRIVGEHLVIEEQPIAPDASTSKSARIKIDGDVLFLTGPDGKVVEQKRLGRPEPGKPAIVGAWQFRHPAGVNGFIRYTDDGRAFLRIPMRSAVGRYTLTSNELRLTRSSQPEVVMAIELRGDELAMSGEGRTFRYRRDIAGPWYDREHINK
jgi:hypothetical protein